MRAVTADQPDVGIVAPCRSARYEAPGSPGCDHVHRAGGRIEQPEAVRGCLVIKLHDIDAVVGPRDGEVRLATEVKKPIGPAPYIHDADPCSRNGTVGRALDILLIDVGGSVRRDEIRIHRGNPAVLWPIEGRTGPLPAQDGFGHRVDACGGSHECHL